MSTTRRGLRAEQILTALMNTGSVNGAAMSLECQQRTIYDRLRKAHFKELYRAAQSEAVRVASGKLSRAVSTAVNVTVNIMCDETAPAQTRLSAANTILNNAARFTEITNILDRLEALEGGGDEEYNCKA